MTAMRPLIILAPILLSATPRLAAQEAIDSVFVEVYHVQPAERPGDPATVTYRIFVDLAEGHELQMVYGDQAHKLRIWTTTAFENDTVLGAKFGHQIQAGRLNEGALALDSYLTIGAADNEHMGVPRAWDKDGSVLTCPPYPGSRSRTGDAGGILAPLCITDGLIPYEEIREVVDFRFASGYLHKARGFDIETTDGAYAVLGGKRGVTDRNVLLIAQLTTTGELSYMLNLQIETPEHEPLKYVARDPGPGEFTHPSLTYGKFRATAPAMGQ